LRAARITNINIDLIAGLPHQTAKSWKFSLAETVATGAPHVSVYMLEVDEDSRLGRELLAGGTRYHAHFVPDEESTADFILQPVGNSNRTESRNTKISNFARAGFESRHNLKYWTRQPYLGFAWMHIRCCALPLQTSSVRFAPADSLERYMSGQDCSGRGLDPGSFRGSFFPGFATEPRREPVRTRDEIWARSTSRAPEVRL